MTGQTVLLAALLLATAACQLPLRDGDPVPEAAEPPTVAEMLDELTTPTGFREEERRAAGQPTAFVGVTVVPMDGERSLPDQTVLVRRGRIAAMGPRGSIELPSGTRILSGLGRWLMPGLADMHIHAWAPNHLLLCLANGVTTVRNMFGGPLHLHWRELIRSRQMVGPRLLTAGPIVDGDPPVWPGSAVVTTAEQGRAAVRQQHEAGYDFIKVYDGIPREAWEAVVDEARLRGLQVCGHVADSAGLHRALAVSQDSIEHLSGTVEHLHTDGPDLRGIEGWFKFHELDDAAMAELAGRVRDAGTWSCPTLVVMDRIVPADEAARFVDEPHMRYVAPATQAMWDPSKDFRFRSWTDEHYAGLRAGDAARRRFVGALQDAGAGLLLGTDAFNPWVVHGFAIHEELRLLVEAGLTPYEALACGTSAVGRFLGESDVGVVAEGARADLLLLEADPLLDVANLTRRVGVMADGAWFPEAELTARLALVARSYGRAP